MSHSNGIISVSGSSGIDIVNDIASVLESSSSDLTTLCNEVSVNMWSQHKPIVLANKITELTTSEWSSNKYGLTLPSTTIGNSSITTVLKSSISYAHPTGTTSAPCRVSDFNGYNHNSIKPYSMVLPSSIIVGGGIVAKMLESAQVDGGISVSDLFGTFYLGVLVVKGSSMQYKTASIAGTGSVSISDCPLCTSGSTVSVYCFATPTSVTSWTTPSGTTQVYSLTTDEESAYAENISCTAAASNTFSIGVLINNNRRYISVGDASLSSGTVYATGTVQSLPSGSEWYISKVLVTRTDAYTSETTSATVTSGLSSVSPQTIYGDYVSGQEIGFSVPRDLGSLFAGNPARYSYMIYYV